MSEPEEERPQPDASPPLRSLEGELMALIASNAVRLQYITIVGAAGAAAVLMLHVPAIYPLAWWALLTGVIVQRTRWLARAQADHTRSDKQKLTLAAWVFSLTASVQSLLMAFLPFVPTGIDALLTIYLVSMAAGMVSSTGGARRVVTSYVCIAIGVMACTWALTPDPERSWLDRLIFAAMNLAYMKVVIDYAASAYRVFEESYRIRLERVDLNERLADALRTADTASRAKTRFLASASHDLRQPIHALALFSGSLQLRPLDARSAGIAMQIDKAVGVLGSQLDGLLDISRLDAGVVNRSIETLDLASVCTQLGDEFAPLAERKGLLLHVQCPRNTWVRSDPMLLRRILGNLISNAIKFTVAGRIDLIAERASGACRICVRDTGPGIPEVEREHVFEEFYQLGNPERDRSNGLGLGLAIVQRLCALLNLELRLESELGRGTTFTLEVPAARIEQLPIPQRAGEDAVVGGGLNVLVVDDEEDVRIGMQTLLEEMGFCVRVVASTQGAVDCCSRDFAPAVVLADFRLFGKDNGIATVRALRRVWPRLPALLISGDTAPDRLREARAEGIELLHKPLNSALLRDSILKATAA